MLNELAAAEWIESSTGVSHVADAFSSPPQPPRVLAGVSTRNGRGCQHADSVLAMFRASATTSTRRRRRRGGRSQGSA